MIATIENAILNRVFNLQTNFGYKYAILESWPDNWKTYLETRLGGLVTPAAWVTFTGLNETDQDLNTRYETVCTARFGIVVAAKNTRNQVAARHGASVQNPLKPYEVGVYQLAQDLIGVLNGWSPHESAGLLMLKSLQTGEVDSTRAANMHFQVLSFECVVSLPAATENPDILPDFDAMPVAYGAPIASATIILEDPE